VKISKKNLKILIENFIFEEEEKEDKDKEKKSKMPKAKEVEQKIEDAFSKNPLAGLNMFITQVKSGAKIKPTAGIKKLLNIPQDYDSVFDEDKLNKKSRVIDAMINKLQLKHNV
jgi:hypothetical protein